MRKRIFSILLAAVMVISLLPTSVQAKSSSRISVKCSAGGTVVDNSPDVPAWEHRTGGQDNGNVTCTLSADSKTLTMSWIDFESNSQVKSYSINAQTGYEFLNWTYSVGGEDKGVLESGTVFTSETLTSYQAIFTANFIHKHNDITFQPWEMSDSLPCPTDLSDGVGSYCLTDDVTLDDTWEVPEGTVNLCLNGHVINLSDAVQGSVIIVGSGATLNLIDCAPNQTHSDVSLPNGGCITGGTGNYTGVYSYNAGEYLKIYGGAGVLVSGGTFNMNGGSIYGNDAGKDAMDDTDIENKILDDIPYVYAGNNGWGGGVFVKSGTFNMLGGTIKSNNADENGGGVYVYSSGVFTMSGGSISDNKAVKTGGGIYVNNATLTMNGSSVVCSNTAGSYAGGVEINKGGSFEMSGNSIIRDNNANYGGGLDCDVSSNVIIKGKASITGNTANTSGGGIYDEGSSTLQLQEQADISCNSAKKTGGGIYVYGATLTMNGSSVVCSNTADSYAGGVEVNKGGSFEMSGNSIIRDNNANNGGGLDCDGSSKVIIKGNASITGNTAKTSGGGIYDEGSSTVTLQEQAVISQNTATDCGGGIYVKGKSTVTLQDQAVISQNTAVKTGGGVNVSVNSESTFAMTGGTIKENTVTGTNTETGLGGGVYVGAGTFFTMSGGSIEDCTANRYGGGVDNYGTFTMSGSALIKNCKTTSFDGGGVESDNDNASFEMSGNASITGCSARNGGGVLLGKGIFTMSDAAAVINNTATTYGGGVYFKSSKPITLGGAVKINGNLKNGTANNLYLNSGKVITLGTGANVPTTMSIGVTMATPGAFTGTVSSTDTAYFFSDDPVYAVQHVTAKLNLVKNWTALNNAMNGTTNETIDGLFEIDNGTIKLLTDFKASANDTMLTVSDVKTLDLNGHVIDGAGISTVGSVISIGSGATLNITDSAPTTEHVGYVDEDGLWHLGTGSGTPMSIIGGIITGGKGKSASGSVYGGGIIIIGGNCTMNGGNIAGNSCSATASKTNALGGGIYVESGAFTMNGGSIVGNAVSASGGGQGSGGGIYIGVGGSANLYGGVISDNVVSHYAGGVYADKGPLKVGGTVIIRNNKSNYQDYEDNGDKENNVMTGSDDAARYILFNEGEIPQTGMNIGIRRANTSVPNSLDVPDYSCYFHSDNNGLYVLFTPGTGGMGSIGFAELTDKYKVEINADFVNGAVYLDKQAAAAGETVTITVVPDDGYKIKRCLPNNKGKVFQPTHNPDGTYTFIMPEETVTVLVEFEKKIAYNVTAQVEDSRGQAKAEINGNLVTEAEKDASVDFTATPDSDYEFDYWEVVSGNVNIEAIKTNNPITVTMPETELTLKAHFKTKVIKYNVIVEDDGHGTAKAQVGSADVTSAASNEEVSLMATPADGYAFREWQIESGLNAGAIMNGTFTMPANEVKIKACFDKIIDKPTADMTSFVFDGTEQTYNPVGFDSVTMEITGNKQTMANETGYTVSVAPKTGYVWSDGTTNCNFTWVIAKAEQTITADDSQSFYLLDTGKSIATELTFGDGTLSYAVKSGNSVSVDAATGALTIRALGDTVITVTASETDNYKETSKNITVSIGNKKIYKPTADTTSFVYNGNEQIYNPAGFDTATMEISGNKRTEANETGYTVSVAPKAGYVWSDGTTSCDFTWIIAKAEQTITVDDPCNFLLTDTDKSVFATVTTGDGTLSYAVKSGNSVSVDAATGALTIRALGDTVITVTASETDNYKETSKNITVSIGNKKIYKPTADTTSFVYNGNEQIYNPAGFDTATMEISGNKQTEANETGYTVSVAPKSGYVWSDGTTSCDFTWIIAKAEQTITADSPLSFIITDTDKSVVATTDGDGTICYIVKSGDSVTVDAATGVLTIAKAGETVITVTAVGTTNYKEATKDILVKIEQNIIPVTEVAVTADRISVPVGESAKTTAIVNPVDATDKNIAWSISDENIATLKPGNDGTATVTGLKKGSVTVTATSVNGVKGIVDIKFTAEDPQPPHNHCFYFVKNLVEATTETEGMDLYRCFECQEPYYKKLPKLTTPEPTPEPTKGPDSENESGATEEYRADVESDVDSVQVIAKIEGGIASVEEIDEELLKDMFSKALSDTEDESSIITINLSKAKQTVEGIELTKQTVTNLADTVNDSNCSAESVEVVMSDVTVRFDAKTLETILGTMAGDTVSLVVESNVDDSLNSKQKKTLEKYDVTGLYEAYFESNGVRIHDFKGGNVTVSIDFKPEKGKKAENYKVYYINAKGKLQRHATKYEKGKLTFITSHFSNYVVLYDEVQDVLLADAVTTGKGYIKLSWNAIEGAEKYVVYGAKCGKAYKELTVTDSTAFTVKKIINAKPVSGKTYKFYVVAYDALGNKIKSKAIHYIAGDASTKYANVKNITPVVKTLELTVGEKATVGAEYTMYEDKKHITESHGKALRFTSDCPDVAKVAKDGTVTAKSEGKAVIYIQDISGKWCKVEVTVKEK